MNEQTARILYRLPRSCQACHDGHKEPCERTVYASPFERRAPCECDHDGATVPTACDCRPSSLPVPTRVNPAVIACDDPAHPNRRRVVEALRARYGPDHYRAIRLGRPTGGQVA